MYRWKTRRDTLPPFQSEAPGKKRSLIRKAPTKFGTGTGKPAAKCQTPGVVTKKLRVARKVPAARMLPIDDTLAEKGRVAISKAITISLEPITFEIPCAPNEVCSQLKSGPWATKGAMPCASSVVNL